MQKPTQFKNKINIQKQNFNNPEYKLEDLEDEPLPLDYNNKVKSISSLINSNKDRNNRNSVKKTKENNLFKETKYSKNIQNDIKSSSTNTTNKDFLNNINNIKNSKSRINKSSNLSSNKTNVDIKKSLKQEYIEEYEEEEKPKSIHELKRISNFNNLNNPLKGSFISNNGELPQNSNPSFLNNTNNSVYAVNSIIENKIEPINTNNKQKETQKNDFMKNNKKTEQTIFQSSSQENFLIDNTTYNISENLRSIEIDMMNDPIYQDLIKKETQKNKNLNVSNNDGTLNFKNKGIINKENLKINNNSLGNRFSQDSFINQKKDGFTQKSKNSNNSNNKSNELTNENIEMLETQNIENISDSDLEENISVNKSIIGMKKNFTMTDLKLSSNISILNKTSHQQEKSFEIQNNNSNLINKNSFLLKTNEQNDLLSTELSNWKKNEDEKSKAETLMHKNYSKSKLHPEANTDNQQEIIENRIKEQDYIRNHETKTELKNLDDQTKNFFEFRKNNNFNQKNEELNNNSNDRKFQADIYNNSSNNFPDNYLANKNNNLSVSENYQFSKLNSNNISKGEITLSNYNYNSNCIKTQNSSKKI